MKRRIEALCLAGLVAAGPAWAASEADKRAVIETYADIAQAGYEDSLASAKDLQAAVGALIAKPSDATLQAARDAWLAARVPYQQTEVYRFGNAIVDDWEGKVNAWPLDEGLIDYVDAGAYGTESDENMLYAANVIANESLTLNGETVDASQITKALLSDTLHEAEEVEANVATGYHAIEFLLWGQDLNGTGPGAGARPASDFDTANCTGGNCDRRAAYLQVATDLLIDDLTWMAAQWAPGGEARQGLLEGGGDAGLSTILTGMGSLSYGELAGERMKLGLLLNDPEEEHDCFSDNTHNSHFYNAVGIRSVYLGSHKRLDGSLVTGASLADLVSAKDGSIDKALRSKLDASVSALKVIVDSAEAGTAYDQMLDADNATGNAKLQAAIDALKDQTGAIEKAVAALGLGAIAFEGSDSLDNPTAVMQ